MIDEEIEDFVEDESVTSSDLFDCDYTPIDAVVNQITVFTGCTTRATENGDRLLYLVAMQKTIDGQKRNPGAVYDNPNTDGDPIPAMNPPYSTMYVPLPSIEYLYSGSYQQP